MNSSYVSKIIVGFFALCVFACGSKPSADNQTTESDTWKEMDDFHMVMAETFHPYKDSADLAPVKAKARELVSSADQWANSPIPAKVNNEDMKTQLQSLKSETEVLADLVQTQDDDAIGNQLTKVHDLFHHIQEAWYVNDHHEHHHDH